MPAPSSTPWSWAWRRSTTPCETASNTPGFTTIFPLLAEVMVPFSGRSDPKISRWRQDRPLAKAENILLDQADQFEQFAPLTIAHTPPIKLGRLFHARGYRQRGCDDLWTGNTLCGSPLQTGPRFDKTPKDGFNNRLDESVYFKFEAPPASPRTSTAEGAT